MMKRYYVTMWRSRSVRDGQKFEWRWRMRASNGKVVGASTEGYRHRGDCIQNIAVVTGKRFRFDSMGTRSRYAGKLRRRA